MAHKNGNIVEVKPSNKTAIILKMFILKTDRGRLSKVLKHQLEKIWNKVNPQCCAVSIDIKVEPSK